MAMSHAKQLANVKAELDAIETESALLYPTYLYHGPEGEAAAAREKALRVRENELMIERTRLALGETPSQARRRHKRDAKDLAEAFARDDHNSRQVALGLKRPAMADALVDTAARRADEQNGTL